MAEKDSNLFSSPMMMHIAGELVVLGGVAFYFHRRCQALEEDLKKTQEQLAQVTQIVRQLCGDAPPTSPPRRHRRRRVPPPRRPATPSEEEEEDDIDQTIDQENRQIRNKKPEAPRAGRLPPEDITEESESESDSKES